MSRPRLWMHALLCAVLAFLPVLPTDAATKKGSSKSTSTAKKKAAAAAVAKKNATSGANTDPTNAPALDLPLPEKVDSAPTERDAPTKTEGSPTVPGESKPATAPEYGPNATVEPDDLVEFATQTPRIQQLIRDALDLTRLHLTYTFGSANPDDGGMDCSGTIHYLLQAHGVKDIARDSAGQYLWARKSGGFFPVLSRSAESVEFEQLQPGDLLFWTGTYQNERDVPISHVMLYLGREKATGQRIMFGASNGRAYRGIKRWGVSVFDFNLPKFDPANPAKNQADFAGFARIPGMRGSAPEAASSEAAKPPDEPKPATKSSSPAKPKSKSSTKKKSKSRK